MTGGELYATGSEMHSRLKSKYTSFDLSFVDEYMRAQMATRGLITLDVERNPRGIHLHWMLMPPFADVVMEMKD